MPRASVLTHHPFCPVMASVSTGTEVSNILALFLKAFDVTDRLEGSQGPRSWLSTCCPRRVCHSTAPEDELMVNKAQTEASAPGISSSWRHVGGAVVQGLGILGH